MVAEAAGCTVQYSVCMYAVAWLRLERHGRADVSIPPYVRRYSRLKRVVKRFLVGRRDRTSACWYTVVAWTSKLETEHAGRA